MGKGGKAAKNVQEQKKDDMMSEWELSDTEDETAAANEGRAPVKKKMKVMTRSEQKAIREKKGGKKHQTATKVQAQGKK